MFENRVEQKMIEEKSVPWTIQQTFLGILLTLIPWLLLALGLSNLHTNTSKGTALSPTVDLTNAFLTFVLASLVEGAFLIAPLYFASHPFRSMTARWRRAFDALGFRSFQLSNTLGWVIVLFVGILVLNFVYSALLGYLNTRFHLQIHTNDQVVLQESRYAPRTTYATLIASVFVAPFCEEVFFRSFVFAGFLRAMSVGWAVFLSALIFAVAHGDAGSFAVLFFIGLALAFLRWRTNSIWPGILLHAFNNGLGALLIVVAMQHPGP